MASEAPVFLDSSCLVALALDEPGAARLRARIATAPSRSASTLAEAELKSALAREGKPLVSIPVPGLEWIAPARRLTRELTQVQEAGYVRGADAWHIACALFLDPAASELTFLSLDAQQRKVARAVGFRVA